MDDLVKKDIRPRIGILIQARTGSTRFPNKVLHALPFGSKTSVLEQIIKRAKKVALADTVVVATTNNKNDAAILALCSKLHIKYFRGDEENVLSRFYYAATKYSMTHIIRLTADNPCIDLNIINTTVTVHLKGQNDYTFTENYPVGMNIEIISFSALKTAFLSAAQKAEEEHVTPYIKANPDKFKISVVKAPKRLSRHDIRLTLDTEEDYALLCAIYDNLYSKNAYFNIQDILSLFNKKPWLTLINRKIIQKKVFKNSEEELQEAVKALKLQDMPRAAEILAKDLK